MQATPNAHFGQRFKATLIAARLTLYAGDTLMVRRADNDGLPGVFDDDQRLYRTDPGRAFGKAGGVAVRLIANASAIIAVTATVWAIIGNDYLTTAAMAVLAVAMAIVSRRSPPPGTGNAGPE
jgi:hypothetical protein